VVPVDADELVLDLLAGGAQPDPRHGWLTPVEQAVTAALRDHHAVSVEATGAWESDWQLPLDLEAAGARVLRVWVDAPLEVTLDRLAHRTSARAPTTEGEARWIHRTARARAEGRTFDLRLDTGGLQPDDLADALAPLAPHLMP
jgi:chloramphenicol 3-O-phosphotransferase